MTLNTPQLPPPDVARIRHRDSRDGFPPFVVEVSDVDDGTWTPISFHEDHASALAALVRVGGELATEDGPTFPHTYPAGDDYRVRAHYPNGHAATYRADVPSDAAAMVRALVATGVAAQVYGPSGLPYTPARDAAAGMLADIATRDDG